MSTAWTPLHIPDTDKALVAVDPDELTTLSIANIGQGGLGHTNNNNGDTILIVDSTLSTSSSSAKDTPSNTRIAGRAVYVADPASMRPRQVWCALVGCPENVARGGVTPDGQELPDWLSWSEFVTTIDGRQVTTGDIVNLPLTYYGPSIPLGDGWSYGGSTSPTATSASSTSTGESESSSGETSTTSLPTTTSQPTSTTSSSVSSSQSSSSISSSTSTSSSSSSSSAASSSSSSSSTSVSSSSSTTTLTSSSSSSSTSTSSSSSSSTSASSPITPSPSSSSSLPSSTRTSTTSSASRSSTRPTTSATTSQSSSVSGISSSSSSGASLASRRDPNRTLKIVLPSVLVPLGLLLLLGLLLWWLLKKKRDRDQERRTAAFRSSKANWSAVPTADPSEKLPSDVPARQISGGPPGFAGGLPAGAASSGNLAAGSVGANAPAASGSGAGALAAGGLAVGAAGGVLAAAGADAAGVGPFAGSKRDSGSSGGTSAGDENSALLGSRAESRAPSSAGSRNGGGFAGIGAGVAGAIGGIGLLRGLGIGRRPSADTNSSDRNTSGERSVSGNTMEKMIGVFKPSSRSGTRSGSGDTTTTTTEMKRSSGGTSTGVYAPVPEEDLFFNVPRPIMERRGSSSEQYYSAESDPLGNAPNKRPGGRFVDPGSTSSSGSRTTSSRSSGRSHGSGSKGSHGSGFRGAGGRVHSTIPEEALVAGAVGAGAAAVHHQAQSDLSLQSVYSQSQYDSVGSGSANSRSASREVDIGEFGARGGSINRPRRGVSRLAHNHPPGAYVERNASVGTFGTPFDQNSLASSEFLTAPAGRSPTPGAPDAQRLSLDEGGSRSSHKRSASTDLMMAAAVEAVKRKRSGSYDRATHRRSESEEPPRNTPSPARHARNASHSLIAPPPGIKRVPPAPVGVGHNMAFGGDLMLSPFGPGSLHSASTQPLTGSSQPHTDSSRSHSTPDKAVRSAIALMENGTTPVGTTSSADGAGRRGSAPRVTLYDEFGSVQNAASRSVPTLALGSRPPSAIGTVASGDTSGSSHSAHWEETAALRGRRVSHPYVFEVGGTGASRASSRLQSIHQERGAGASRTRRRDQPRR